MSNSKVVDSQKLEETVLLQFTVPSKNRLPGATSDNAPYSVLSSQAKDFEKQAKSISEAVKTDRAGLFSEFRAFGEWAGQKEGESNEDYQAQMVTVRLPNGSTYTVPVSVVLADSVEAMIKHLTDGGVGASFEEFLLSQKLLKKAPISTNAKPGELFAPTEHTHCKVIVGVQAVGTDNNGKLKGFYEVLALAAKAVRYSADEIKALGYIGGMGEKTGLSEDSLHKTVQLVINATVASELRKEAKVFTKRADEARQKSIQSREEKERLAQISRGLEHQKTNGLEQAH